MAGVPEKLPIPAIPRRMGQCLRCRADARCEVGEGDPHAYFDRYFQPYAVVRQTGPLREDIGLITGYYEPLLKGSRNAVREIPRRVVWARRQIC